jgi:hypothetical protein
MPTYTNPLDNVKVAAPCPADWGKMVGDERVRYCDGCSLHVYNLSGMTRRAAEGLIASTEGRLCVRFYRRADGTILTRNCPTGLAALKRRAARAATATLTAVLGFFAALGFNSGVESALSPELMEESAVPAPSIPDVELPTPAPELWLEQGEAPLDVVPMMGVMVADEETVKRSMEAERLRELERRQK